MKNKNSTISIDVLIYLAIGVVVFLVLVFIVPRLLGNAGDETCRFLTSTRDHDGDGIADFFDKCPCDSGDEAYDGCKTEEGYKDYSETEIKNCKSQIKSACERDSEKNND